MVVDPASLPPLFRLAYEGKGDQIEQAIEQGADVKATCAKGWSLLHLAALGGHQQTCGLILNHGADIHQKDAQGHTAADLAQLRGHDGTAGFLRQMEQK
jgi:hypothetical protein